MRRDPRTSSETIEALRTAVDHFNDAVELRDSDPRPQLQNMFDSILRIRLEQFEAALEAAS